MKVIIGLLIIGAVFCVIGFILIRAGQRRRLQAKADAHPSNNTDKVHVLRSSDTGRTSAEWVRDRALRVANSRSSSVDDLAPPAWASASGDWSSSPDSGSSSSSND